MCEQYHTAHGLQIVMLRPDHIVDSRSGWNRAGQLTSAAVLETQGDTGWVCRHDLASACVLAAETPGLGLEYLSVVGQTPVGKPLPEQTCNVIRTKQLLGWEVCGDLEQWRAGSSAPRIELSPAQQRTFVDEGFVVPSPANWCLDCSTYLTVVRCGDVLAGAGPAQRSSSHALRRGAGSHKGVSATGQRRRKQCRQRTGRAVIWNT